MTTPRARIADMTSYEFAERMKDDPIVVLPTGSVEQHGPHLPLLTDVILPSAVAEAVAALVGGLVAPPVTYGYKSQPKSGGGNHFPGTLSLDADVFVGLVRNIINELARHGVRKIVLFDGHMENQWFLVEAADLEPFPRALNRRIDRDRGAPHGAAPPTPPGIRVRTTAVRPE